MRRFGIFAKDRFIEKPDAAQVARVTLRGGILTSFAKASGTAFSRFRVKPALLFVAHLQNAPDNPPGTQIQAIRPKSPPMLPLKRHSRRQSSVTKRRAIANTDEPNTGGLSCYRA